MARFALEYPMNYWKILIPFLAARHQRTRGREGDQRGRPKRMGRLGWGCSFPLLSALGFKGAQSCCRRPLQPSLHPDLSLSPFAWQVCLSTFFPTSPPFPVLVAWPGCQVTTHWDTSSSFPSVQDLGEPPFFSCQPQGTFLMLSVTYCTTVVISWTNIFSIFVVNPKSPVFRASAIPHVLGYRQPRRFILSNFKICPFLVGRLTPVVWIFSSFGMSTLLCMLQSLKLQTVTPEDTPSFLHLGGVFLPI